MFSADSITDDQIRSLSEQIQRMCDISDVGRSALLADCQVALSAPVGSLRRAQARGRCADVLNEQARR